MQSWFGEANLASGNMTREVRGKESSSLPTYQFLWSRVLLDISALLYQGTRTYILPYPEQQDKNTRLEFRTLNPTGKCKEFKNY